MAKEILILGDLASSVITEGTGSYNAGILLSEQPSADVTVTFTSRGSMFTVTATLTFTSSNWQTPQYANISATSNGVTNTFRYDYLDITCSGGGYDSVTKTIAVGISDNTTYRVFQGSHGWIKTAFPTDSSLSAKMDKLVLDMFNGDGIPTTYSLQSTVTTTSPTATTLQDSGSNQMPDATWSTIDKWTFRNTDSDGYNYDCIGNLIKPNVAVTRVSKLWVDLCGSGGEGHDKIWENMLPKGWDILNMSYCPFNHENTTNNPGITEGANVQQLVSASVDKVGFNAYKLIVNQIVNAVVKAMEGTTYTEIAVSGISGSGFPSLVAAAVLTKLYPSTIIHNFYWRGSLLRGMNNQSSISGAAGAVGTICGLWRYGVSSDSTARISDMFRNTGWGDMVGAVLDSGGVMVIYGNTNDGSGASWTEAAYCTPVIKLKYPTTYTRYYGVYDALAGRSAHAWADADFAGWSASGPTPAFTGIFNVLGI